MVSKEKRDSRKGKAILQDVPTRNKLDQVWHSAAHAKHRSQVQSGKGNHNISTLIKRNSFENERKVIEIKLCAFMAEHSLPISSGESFVELLKSLFPDEKPLALVKLGKQKATNIIRQVLGFDYIRKATKLLRLQRFSTIIDETTDISTRN